MLFIFLVDFGGQSGWGHYSRCLALSERLLALGYKVVFSAISEDQLPRSFIPFDELDNYGSRIASSVSLIVDTYFNDGEFDKYRDSIKPTKSMKITDTGKYLVGYDSVLATGSFPKNALVDLGATIFSGIEYFLLRPEFNVKFKKSMRRSSRVTVFFGGGNADVYNRQFFFEIQQSKVIKVFDVEVVVISESIDTSLSNVCIGESLIRCVRPSKEYAELLSNSWLGIGGMGVSFWERVALRVPTLGVVMAANQTQNSEVLIEAELGQLCEFADLVQSFERLLNLKYSIEDPSIKWSKNCESFGVGVRAHEVLDFLTT